MPSRHKLHDTQMARRKFRHSQRKKPSNVRSYQEYISNQSAPLTTRTELLRLIRGGEDTYLELKLKLSNSDKIAKGIVALANTAGGTMIFGVSDQLRVEGVRNPEGVQEELVRICREEIYPPLVPHLDSIAFDDGSRIIALDVVPKNKPYRTRKGKYFLRIGAEKREATCEELSDLIDEVRPLSYENTPITGASVEDFDDGLLWGFANEFVSSEKRKRYDTRSLLEKDLLLAIRGSDEFLPTVAAALLFGEDERVPDLLPQSGVTITRFSGADKNSEIVEQAYFTGNLASLNENLTGFIERYCDLWKFRSKEVNSQAHDEGIGRANYHLYAVKEALANLLAHRDLALREIETKISIFDTAIEFSNPRRTNGFVPPASKAIRFGITQRVNPQLMSIFSRREYGAKIPQGGLPMVLKQSELFSGQKPELLTTNDRFRLKLHAL